MRKILILLTVFSMIGAPAAASQFESQRVEGEQRVCVYAGETEGRARERRVGLGQDCPSYYRTSTSSLTVPPTARLVDTQVRGGKRVCNYAQLSSRWSLEVPIGTPCTMSAGQLPR